MRIIKYQAKSTGVFYVKPLACRCTLTLVMQSRAKRKVRKAVAKVKSFLFLLRILKSSVRPVMTASMPPIW